MILFSILTIWSFITSNKKLFFVVYLISTIVFTTFLLETGLFNIQYLVSDELRYFQLAEQYIAEGNERSLWLYINLFLKEFDFLGAWYVKIINIPISVILIDRLNKIFKLKNKLFLLIICPFIVVMSLSNLRDLLILLTTLYVCRYLHEGLKGSKYGWIKLIICCMALLSLRPIFLFISLFIFALIKFVHKPFKDIRPLTIISFFLLGLIVFFQSSNYINSTLYNANYLFEKGLELKAEEKGFSDYFDPNNYFSTFFYAFLRYLVTPFPTSLISRFLSDHFFIHGRTFELVRILHQINYFLIAIISIWNFKVIFKIFISLSSLQKLILFNLISYFPVYSIYAFGGVHQRTKLPFQIALAILLILYYENRKIIHSRKNKFIN